jgi:CheY-like chemotaxis protein
VLLLGSSLRYLALWYLLANSKQGQGTTFIIEIAVDYPLPKESTPPLEDKKNSASQTDIIKDKKILLVEDMPDNQLLVKLYLQPQGIHLSTASNGLEGLERAQQEEFDLILMDMQMPVMDGYTATSRLREKGFSKPIIALTAHAMKEDRTRCLKAGCTDYLTKPVRKAELLALVCKYGDPA